MRCFVTGATGFVGGRLVERLLAAGHEVGALIHEEARAAPLREQGCRAVIGLPEALDDMFPAQLGGVEVLFHCDAYLDPQGPREAFRQVNVVGTRRVLDAAIFASVRRVVHLSSQAVVWDGRSLHETDEDTPYPSEHVDPYSASRAEAERLVLVAARAGRIEAVAIRPGWTWGPGDAVLLPMLVRRALKAPIPLVGSGEYAIATTYIDHLVDALLAAATVPGISGRAYFVSDDMGLTQRAFMDMQLGAVGIVPRYRHIPPMVAKAAAAVVEAAAPWVGAPLPLIRLATGMAAGEITHNTSRARQELGFEPRVPLEEGLARLQAWAATAGGPTAIAQLGAPPIELEGEET